MKKYLTPVIIIIVLIFAAKFFVFRGGPPGGMGGKMPPTVVETDEISEIEVKEKIEATGRVESPDRVDIIARIEGYLQKAYFQEGSYVKKGDLLFLIEPDRYQITVQQAAADVKEAEAALLEAEKNFVRIAELVEKDYASKAQLDDITAKKDRTTALLGVKLANLEQAKLNMAYTRISAPISGRIGKIRIDEGNVVSPATGSIARIVSLNPIYVNYNISSDDYLKLIKSNKADKSGEVEIKLPDNSVYSEKGRVIFFDNEVDSTTGTLDVRAEFKNTDYILIPGQYVSVVMYVGKPEKILAVPQEAVLDNTQGKYVYVLQEDSTVQVRPIQVEKQYEGYWLLKDGLKAGETVVVKGTQKLRPDMKVTDKKQVNKNGK